MKHKTFKLRPEDFACFQMLWKWKFLTTAALQKSVYAKRSYYRTYRRLHDLAQGKFIKCITSIDGYSYVWQLDEKGMLSIRDRLPELKMDGYLSENKNHDFWVSAIHLGEWLEGPPDRAGIFSEQELRRAAFESYPSWVPKTSSHRPDGWWKTDLERSDVEALIALEVELSKKTPLAYKEVGEFYSTTVQPYQVIWVVPTSQDFKYILSHLRTGSQSSALEQSFVSLNQYLKRQWHSQIELGKNQGSTLLEILGKAGKKDPKDLSGSFLLDTRKCPVDSVPSRLLQNAEVGLNR